MKTFTQQEIANWEKCEKVRQSGEFNMFAIQAQEASGLTYDEFMFVMKNYSELANAQPRQ